MKRVTLGELLRCERQYAKAKLEGLTDTTAWERDLAALKTAIEHSRRGTPVFVTNNVGETLTGQDDYYILAAGEELEATLCSNHLGKRVSPISL